MQFQLSSAAHTRRLRVLQLAWSLTRQTLEGFSHDRGDLVAAALAFYTLLSLAPLILIAVAIAGFALGDGSAQQEVSRLLDDSMGHLAATSVMNWVEQAAKGGAAASTIGLTFSLLAASRLTTQLRNALNQIWNVEASPSAGPALAVADFFKQRAFALLLVLAAGPLLLLVGVSRALLTAFHHYLFESAAWSGVAVQGLQILLSLGLVLVMSALLFRYVPDTEVPWSSAWRGAALTSVLFNIGNVLTGLYLGRASVAAAYGAAGSVIVVLLWLQVSASILLLGAEFTQRLTEYRDAHGPERQLPSIAARTGSPLPHHSG